MKKLLVLNLALIFMPGAHSAAAQIPTPQPTPVRSVSDARDLPRRSPEITDSNALEEERDLNRRPDREFRPFWATEISDAAREKVKITKADKLRYKEITEENDLKILKMFSAPQCAENRLILNAADEKCAQSADWLRVSFYSFLRGFYGETIGDFRILEDDLIAGNGGYIHGFLVDLGEIEIGKINKESAAVAILKNYPLALTAKEEAKQRSDLEKGFGYQDLNISSRQKLKAGHVYLVRLVSYSFKDDYANIYNKDAVFLLKAGSLNEDGMTIILWKKLAQKNAPRLKNE